MGNSKSLKVIGSISAIWGGCGMFLDVTNGASYLIKSDLINIPWSVFYSLLLAIGSVTFLWMLSELIACIYKHLKSLKIEADRSAHEAVNYIISNSHFGRTLSYNEIGFESAALALKEQIEKGKLKIWGISKNSYIPVEIKNPKNIDFDVKKVSLSMSSSDYQTFWGLRNDKKEIICWNIMVSNKQLKKIFRHKHGWEHEFA